MPRAWPPDAGKVTAVLRDGWVWGSRLFKHLLLQAQMHAESAPGSTAVTGAWITLPDYGASSGGMLISYCSLAR